VLDEKPMKDNNLYNDSNDSGEVTPESGFGAHQSPLKASPKVCTLFVARNRKGRIARLAVPAFFAAPM
jgi:hypothetical protein